MSKDAFMDYLNALPKPWKFLAPMVGLSDEPYRALAMDLGADICYSEMVNSKVYNANSCNPLINQWYTSILKKRPFVIQICGNNPAEMLKTCLKVQDYCDAIDINFGCPQEIAKKGFYGSYLQDDWDLIKQIVSACSKGTKVPIFCKIRVFESIDKSIEYAKIFEASGASLLAVHGRTREQRGENTGLASWEHIKAIKDKLKIPIIANGNMIYPKDVYSCYEYTKCDGVMIAEPHLYNPCIFSMIQMDSITIFSKYLQIIDDMKVLLAKEIIHSRQETLAICLGSIRSHAFKIFNSLFLKMPELREELGKCRNVKDFLEFVENIKNLLRIGNIDKNDLLLKPYIRSKPK